MKTLSSLVNESLHQSLQINEYLSYRVSNWGELINGLAEIGAPVKIDKGKSSISVDDVAYRLPKDLTNISTDIAFDKKIVDALRKNTELTKMWKDVNSKYSSILKNLRNITSIAGSAYSPEHINWGNTGPANINDYFSNISKQYKFLNDLIGNASAQKTLRQYEILRHLYDDGYMRMAGFK